MAPHRWSHADGFDDVLSLDDVDRALTGAGLRRPAFRLVRDGDVLPAASYTRRARTGAAQIDDLIDVGRVLDLFADGATVVLQGLQRWWPPAARFCRDLELDLGHPLQANAYLTPAGAAGLAPHHDTHDVFVLQLAGTKHWTVRAPVVATPLPRHVSDHDEAAASPVVFEAEMVPGDVLYLPRGHVHSAEAQLEPSLHLTLGVLATTVHDVLRELVDLAGDDVAFRPSLPAGWPHDDGLAAATVKAAAADLADWLGRVDPDEVAARLRDRFVSNRTPLLGGQLHEIVALDRIDDDTLVTLRPGTIHALHVRPGGAPGTHRPDARDAIRDDGASRDDDASRDDGASRDDDASREGAPGHGTDDRLELVLGDRRVTLPIAVAPAVRRLIDGGTHRVGALADMLDQRSRLVLVRRLVRDGVLRTGPATDG